jgi:hypothetical protein
MALASIIRSNALQILGAGSCKAMSVSLNNSRYHKLLNFVGLPSLESMAKTDAVATVRQVSKIFPQFFVGIADSGINCPLTSYFPSTSVSSRPIRKRRRVGTKLSHDCSSAIVKANFPEGLSNPIIDADAIIGDVWRLAIERIKEPEKQPNIYTVLPYMEKYEVAIRYCTNGDKTNYLDALDCYKLLCRLEFNILEVQDRRANFSTPTKPLITSKICKISPPEWDTKARRNLRYFSCSTDTPWKVDRESVTENDLRLKLVRICVVCGYKIEYKNSGESNSSPLWDHKICRDCGRSGHPECIKWTFIKGKTFRCRYIKRQLGKNGIELFHSGKSTMTHRGRPIVPRLTCIICGEQIVFGDLHCNQKCGYSAHPKCIQAHEAVLGNTEYLITEQFDCNLVEYQFRYSEIQTNVINNKINVSALTKIAKKREKINSAKYSNKRKRWENDEIQCDDCGQWFGLNESDHIASFCTAAKGDPISKDNLDYPYACIKRFRHLCRKTP